MIEVTRLDMNQMIVDDQGRPTPYFESIFQQILARTGDEADDFIDDLQNGNDSNVTLSASAKISTASKQIEDLSRSMKSDAKVQGQLSNLKKSIDDIQKSLPTRTSLASLKSEIEAIKRSIPVIKNQDSLKKDIEDIKLSLPVRQSLDTIIKRIENIEKVI